MATDYDIFASFIRRYASSAWYIQWDGMVDFERLSKSELLSEAKPSTSFSEEVWDTLRNHKESLVLPALIVGAAAFPIAYRAGAGAIAAYTGRNAESATANCLKSELRSFSLRANRVGEECLSARALENSSISLSEGKMLSHPLPNYYEAVPPSRNLGLASSLEHSDNRISNFIPGRSTIEWVNVNGEERSFMVHVPRSFDPEKQTPLVVALDGFLVRPKNPFRGLAEIDGINQQSEKLGFIAMYPAPKPRYAGTIFSWNEPDGAVNFVGVRKYSDNEYIRRAMEKTMNSFPIDKDNVYGIGFSQGALQLHDFASKSAPGTFKAIASIAGTTKERVAQPPAGTRLLVIHSESDPTLPYYGGTGSSTRIFDRYIGWRYAEESKPWWQAQRYLDANRISSEPIITEHPQFTVRSWSKPGSENPFVQELIFKEQYGYGHTFPGRVRSEPVTVFARVNGLAASPTVLDAKRFITEQFFGLGSKNSA